MKARKITAALAAGALTIGALAGCGLTENEQRKAAQKSVTLKSSQGQDKLKEKLKRESDPSALRYLYLMNYGEIVGYYTTKGKISSSGSQLAPENDVIYGGGNGNVVDSAKDDGTYGEADPGIFFFTTNGTMVVTSLDYIQSDAPLSIDVPRLG